jgi:hypothetical protein
MGFLRNQLASAATLTRPARQGDGLLAHPIINTVSADANAVLTIPQVMGGIVQYTGFTAGRTITTPTAALLLAAMPDMDIGDTYSMMISVTPAFAGTYVAGTGVTLAGRATTPASSFSWIVIEKLSSTTVKWTVL